MQMESNDHIPKVKNFTRAERAFIFALDTLLQTKSFNDIHVTDLLKVSGFSKGAFYGRFDDKYDFARKIIIHAGQIHSYYLSCHSRLLRQGFISNEPISTANALEMFQFIYEYRGLYDMILDQKLIANGLDLFMLDHESPINAELRKSIPPDGFSDQFMRYFGFYSSILYVIIWRHLGYERITPREMVQMVNQLEGKFADIFRSIG